MKKEKWIRWKPIEKISEKLYLEELKCNKDGLTLNLKENKNSPILIIHFDGYFSYRVTDEGDLLKTLYEIEESEDLGKWTLFVVENSLYIQWFHKQSFDTHRDDEIVHYLIATPNDVIEVLDSDIPTVKWN